MPESEKLCFVCLKSKSNCKYEPKTVRYFCNHCLNNKELWPLRCQECKQTEDEGIKNGKVGWILRWQGSLNGKNNQLKCGDCFNKLKSKKTN